MTSGSQPIDEAADRLATHLAATGPGPGVAVALTDRIGSQRVLVKGQASVLTTEPIGGDSVFQIGSVSKAITAAALLRLADKGGRPRRSGNHLPGLVQGF